MVRTKKSTTSKTLWYDSDKIRLLKAFKLQKPDRVPYFEFFDFSSSIVSNILNINLNTKYPDWDTAVEFAQPIGMDAVIVSNKT